jgi:TolB protein
MHRRSLGFFAVLVLFLVLLPVTGSDAAQKKTKTLVSCTLKSGSHSGTPSDSGPGTSSASSPSTTSDSTSSTTNTLESNGQSLNPAVSDDGRFVAYTTSATNSIPADPILETAALPDTNGQADVYVLDREGNSLLRVTYNYFTGAEANGSTGGPIDISADGRYVVYVSGSTNLGPSDTNGVPDVYRFDQMTGRNQLVSLTSSGAQVVSGVIGFPTISADGNLIAFSTDAPLVPNDTNAHTDVFVRNMTAGTTTRVSVDSTGAQAPHGGDDPRLSANGRFVAFDALDRLVPEDGNLSSEVYLRDLQAGQTSRVSVSVTGGDPSGGYSTTTDISADGRYVVFTSIATNLVSGDQNDQADVFVRDRVLGTTVRASVDANGAGGNGYSDAGTISSDGHYVAFETSATNLWPTEDQNGTLRDIFEFDVYANRLWGLLSVGQTDSGEVWGNGKSFQPAISGDNLFVAFSSRATNLSIWDTNGWEDIFTHTWVDPLTRGQCDTEKRSIPLPAPLWFIRLPAPPATDYDRKCQDDIPTSGRTDPAPNKTETRQFYDVFDEFQAVPPGGGFSIPAYLRYGEIPTYTLKDGWKGWGYRKIYLKHGWSAKIRANVVLALAEPPDVPEHGNAAIYEADYVYKGSSCRIRVVVLYEPLPWEATAGLPARNIITVYSRKL